VRVPGSPAKSLTSGMPSLIVPPNRDGGYEAYTPIQAAAVAVT